MSLIRAATARPLSEEDWATVRAQVIESIAAADAQRSIPLENGDQPAPDFVPYRAEPQA
jgi:hypothetical protein